MNGKGIRKEAHGRSNCLMVLGLNKDFNAKVPILTEVHTICFRVGSKKNHAIQTEIYSQPKFRNLKIGRWGPMLKPASLHETKKIYLRDNKVNPPRIPHSTTNTELMYNMSKKDPWTGHLHWGRGGSVC